MAVVLLALGREAAGGSRVVHGVVVSAETGDAIAGAAVLSERGSIAITEGDGAFTLRLDDSNELTVTAAGFATRSVLADASGDTFRIALEPAHGSEVIEVSGKAPEQTKPLSYQLTADEIRFLPGAANDILRAAQALPGVSRIPYSFGGLVLRGTSPRDTAVYLDGIEVPLAFHFGGITSFYPGTMLEDLTVTSGGFDVSHGRAQGGLVTLTTREPRTDVWRVGGTIGLLDSGVFAEGPVAGGGIVVGVRRSYLDTILAPFVEDDVPLPSYWDFQIRTSFGDPRVGGRITPMIFGSVDRVVNTDLTVTSLFLRAAVPYTRAWGPLTLHVVPWVGWTHLALDEHDSDRGDSVARPTVPGGVRSDLTRDYRWGHIRSGVDVDSGYLAQTSLGSGGNSRKLGSSLAWTDIAAWSETRVQLDGGRISLKPGARADYYGISSELVVDPRLNIQQRLLPWLSLRQAIGRFHQPPIPADVDPHDGNPSLHSSYMDQASLGLDATVCNDWIASATSFAAYGNNLGVPVSRGPGTPVPDNGGLGPTFELLLEKQLGISQYRENRGRARQVGLELLVKHSTPRWFFLAAYTLAWAQRIDTRQNAGLGWHAFELDQRHNINVAVSVRLAKWRLGARVQLTSGNPYSPTISFGEIPAQAPFAGRLPPFFHLDLRVDRQWERDWGAINLYFDITNVTNRRNVEGRDFAIDDKHPLGYDKDIPGLPIVPFIGVEFIPN